MPPSRQVISMELNPGQDLDFSGRRPTACRDCRFIKSEHLHSKSNKEEMLC